jgi:hypothetical protein
MTTFVTLSPGLSVLSEADFLAHPVKRSRRAKSQHHTALSQAEFACRRARSLALISSFPENSVPVNELDVPMACVPSGIN